MRRMPRAKSLGHEDIDTLAEQVLPRVAEQPLGLAVHEQNDSFAVDDDNGVRRGFEQSAELLFGLLALADVAHSAHHDRTLVRGERA